MTLLINLGHKKKKTKLMLLRMVRNGIEDGANSSNGNVRFC